MSDILQKIIAVKHDEIAAARAQHSFAALNERAQSRLRDDPPRGF